MLYYNVITERSRSFINKIQVPDDPEEELVEIDIEKIKNVANEEVKEFETLSEKLKGKEKTVMK